MQTCCDRINIAQSSGWKSVFRVGALPIVIHRTFLTSAHISLALMYFYLNKDKTYFEANRNTDVTLYTLHFNQIFKVKTPEIRATFLHLLLLTVATTWRCSFWHSCETGIMSFWNAWTCMCLRILFSSITFWIFGYFYIKFRFHNNISWLDFMNHKIK